METNQMQQTRLILKILSILIIVMSVVMIVFSALSLTGGTMLSSLGMQPTPEAEADQATQEMAFGMGVLAIVFGVILLIAGIFDLITGIMGYKGAKGNPRSAGKAKVMGAIIVLFVTAYNVYLIANNPSAVAIASAMSGIALQCWFVQAAYKVQRENAAMTRT